MSAASVSDQPRRSSADAGDLYPFTLGGAVMGAVAAVFGAMVDATALALIQYFAGSANSNSAWPQWAVVAFGLFALFTAALIGRWVFGLRRWVGLKGDPEDRDVIAGKRRHFAIGALVFYVPLSIAICFLMIAIANTT